MTFLLLLNGSPGPVSHSHGTHLNDRFVRILGYGKSYSLCGCSYLIHPFVLTIFAESSHVPLHYTDLNGVYWYLGTLALTHLGALLVHVFVEAPLAKLIKACTSSSRSK